MWSRADFRAIPEIAKNPQMPVCQGVRAFWLLPVGWMPIRSQMRRDTNFAIPGYSISAMIPRRGGKSKIFCLWSFMWSKPLLCRFRQPGKIQQTQVLQGFAAFRLAPSRIPPRHSQSRRATNFAIPGYLLSIAQLWVEGKRKFLVYINKVVIGGRLPADDDLIQICIKRLACCALRQREGDIRAEKVGVDGQVEAAAL